MAPDATTVPEMAGAELGSGTSKITKTPGPSAAVLYIEINLPSAVLIPLDVAHHSGMLSPTVPI